MSQDESAEYTSFLGTGWSFPPAFSRAKKGVEMVSDEEDIEGSLRILLSTSVGERILQPEYGCNIDHLIFEPLNTTLKTYITGLIEQAILFFEPRIELNSVSLEADELEGRVDIVIDYTVRTTNSRYNLVYPFYRNEAENV
ncbi:MAG: GPW/gp25 family protein [Nitrospirae bacterium]|nr:GPW/gp25 family protein [Nitrospirota bacterium]